MDFHFSCFFFFFPQAFTVICFFLSILFFLIIRLNDVLISLDPLHCNFFTLFPSISSSNVVESFVGIDFLQIDHTHYLVNF